MKTISSKHRKIAFTFIELLFVFAAVGLMAFAGLAYLSQAKVCSHRMRCASNQKMIALSFKMFAGDNDQSFPYQATNSVSYGNTTNNWIHFLAMSNELGSTKILLCPEDSRRWTWVAGTFYPVTNSGLTSLTEAQNRAISYFVSIDADETKPDLVLTGDRNIILPDAKASGPLLETTGTNLLRWSSALHTNQGYVALSDGSVGQLRSNYPIWKDHTNKVRLLLPN